MPVPSPHRRAFTLIELMVVMVIIVILAGLVVIGISSIIDSTRDDSTETRLEMLKGFMAAYANSENARAGGQGNTRAASLPSALQAIPGAGNDYYSTFDGYSDADPNNVVDVSARPRQPLRAPARFNDETLSADQSAARTQAVLRRLLSVPANQSAYNALPEDAKTRALPTAGSILSHSDAAAEVSTLDPALVVDGHGNVIIFVPQEGLTDVAFTDGTRLDFDTSDPTQSHRLVAADGGAFWASGGPDGNLQTADDNVYSTQVIRWTPPTP